MKNYLIALRALLRAAVAVAAMALLVTGCSTTPAQAPAGGAGQAASAMGPQLWSQNCMHCHNLRSPTSYSDSQWEVVALHMRVRANLTADEHRKILAFLKSAH